jgi:putative glutamine amidotransferase
MFIATRGMTPRRCERSSEPLSRVSTWARSSMRLDAVGDPVQDRARARRRGIARPRREGGPCRGDRRVASACPPRRPGDDRAVERGDVVEGLALATRSPADPVPGVDLDAGDDDVGRRLRFADAVLLPGGGDLDPSTYGQATASEDVYDVDAEQDAFDLAVARWALDAGVPLLAVCRGWQVVNVALGGDLEQHMAQPHRHVVHDVRVAEGSRLASVVGTRTAASCYHHQRAARLGDGLVPVAYAADGTVEGAELPTRAGGSSRSSGTRRTPSRPILRSSRSSAPWSTRPDLGGIRRQGHGP